MKSCHSALGRVSATSLVVKSTTKSITRSIAPFVCVFPCCNQRIWAQNFAGHFVRHLKEGEAYTPAMRKLYQKTIVQQQEEESASTLKNALDQMQRENSELRTENEELRSTIEELQEKLNEGTCEYTCCNGTPPTEEELCIIDSCHEADGPDTDWNKQVRALKRIAMNDIVVNLNGKRLRSQTVQTRSKSTRPKITEANASTQTRSRLSSK